MYKITKQYRLPGYDYSNSGYYFVTICTKERQCFFGKIVQEKMVLSMTGEIAEKFWKEIPERFPVVRLDAWIIMPNHIHGILAIEQHDGNMRRRNASGRVPTRGIHPLIPNSVSSIINHYKGNVKRYCDRNNMSYFAWQPRFHDRIIRSEPALQAIRRYIRENPARWGKDK